MFVDHPMKHELGKKVSEKKMEKETRKNPKGHSNSFVKNELTWHPYNPYPYVMYMINKLYDNLPHDLIMSDVNIYITMTVMSTRFTAQS